MKKKSVKVIGTGKDKPRLRRETYWHSWVIGVGITTEHEGKIPLYHVIHVAYTKHIGNMMVSYKV